VVKIDGKMIDKPHLRAAEKILTLRRSYRVVTNNSHGEE
jgi:citrate lyase beta subunit